LGRFNFEKGENKMISTLNLENDTRVNIPAGYRSDAPESAKISARLCVGCAVVAIFFAFFSAAISFGGLTITIYLIFLLLTAALALVGYSEIKATGCGWTNTILMFVSIVFLFISFLYGISGEVGRAKFGAAYGIFAVLIPLLLTIFSLATKKVTLWKALLPLAVPALHALAYLSLKPAGGPFALALLPLGWSLLGIAAARPDK
jgi:hypothetical protein